jgi:hypothetical protein
MFADAPAEQTSRMAVRLYEPGYEHAKKLVKDGHGVHDDRDAWSEHQPSAADENRFIEQHGFDEYALWHLGVDDDESAGTKAHYKFPYGDFEKVHRCGLLSAETRAAQRHYDDIEDAAHRLHEMLDASAGRPSERTR